MKTASLERAVLAGERLLLDTTTIIAHLNGGESVSQTADHIIDVWIHNGRNASIVSMITVMETLVRPIQKSTVGFQHARDFLTRFPNLKAAAIDMDVASEAAALRARDGFTPPDTLIIATGLTHQVGWLVTNDTAWKRKLAPLSNRIRVLLLSDFA